MTCLCLGVWPTGVRGQVEPAEALTSPDELTQIADVEQGRLLLESIRGSMVRRTVDRAAVEGQLLRVDTRLEVLMETTGAAISTERPRLVHEIARHIVQLGELRAVTSVFAQQDADDTRLIDNVETQIAQYKVAEDDSKLREERDSRTRSAESRVEDVLARESAERDQTMRNLLQRERELAEKLLAVTLEANARMTRLEEVEQEAGKRFEEVKGRLLAEADEVDRMLNPSAREREADPVFIEALQSRRRAREALLESFRSLNETSKQLSLSEERLQSARAAHSAETARETELGSSEILKQRVLVAQAEVDLREREVAFLAEENAYWKTRIDGGNTRSRFYSSTMEQVLPHVSSKARSQLYGFSDETFREARISVELGIARLWNWWSLRTSQLIDLGFSIDILTWFLAFGLRLLVFLAISFVSLKWLSVIFHGVHSRVMTQRTLRRWPSVVSTVLELAFALIRPYILYRAFIYPVGLVIESFPEFSFAEVVIRWVFFFTAITAGSRTMFLPRSVRQTEFKSGLGLQLPDEISLLNLEISQARKYVKSARVLALFWLFATLIPAAIETFFGLSILSYLVETSAFVVLAVIVYWVIATWRTEIASLFARVAETRLPRAVLLVNAHKDRFYGVLLVAGATLYIIVVETARLARKHLVDTRWFAKAANFWFRKRIEMQNREAQARKTEWCEADVPDEYRAFFGSFELPNPKNGVGRPSDLNKIRERFDIWKAGKGSGSVAVVGEMGMGRSSLLRSFEVSVQGVEVTRVAISEKSKTGEDTRRLVMQILGIENAENEEIPTTDALVERIKAMPRRVIVLDDCHNMFVRRIGGFDGLDTLLRLVTLTDEHHFWVLSFNIFAWNYVNRVRSREFMFAVVLEMMPWTIEEIRTLIEARHGQSGYAMSFSELVVDMEETQEGTVDVVKTSQGYFKYLHEISGGNPRLAMIFWLRSLRLKEGDERRLEVSLFKQPQTSDIEAMEDGHWFVLTAIAQHGELNAVEVSEITNLDVSFCALAFNFFEGRGVTLPLPNGRVRIEPLYFKQIVRYLKNSNFLYT